MNHESTYSSAAATFALEELNKSDKSKLIAHSQKVDIPLDCLDHVPPDLETEFTRFRKKYLFYLGCGSDGAQAINTESHFGG